MTLLKLVFILLIGLLAGDLSIHGLLISPSKIISHKYGRKCGSSFALAPGSMTESVNYLRENLQTPPDSIIKAVENLGANVPISVGDASALSGTDLNTARLNLMILATLTSGDLEVTPDGEILYSFPNNVRSILERRSFGQKIKVTYKSLYPYLLYALRASFGIFLFTSLAILMSTFVAISTGSENNDDRDRGNNRGRGGGRLLPDPSSFGQGLLESFYFRPYYGYYQTPGYRPDYSTRGNVQSGERSGVTFLESFFSYVFGDGDPNAEFSNEQLRAVASRIRQSGGVVVADELAPYLDPPALKVSRGEYDGTARSYDSYVVDESWVLPAVLQLGGMPLVTDEGNIVYQFQELAATDKKALNTPAPLVLLEKETPFSAASGIMQLFAAGLGFANLAGAVWLGRLLSSAAMTAREPVLMGTLARIYPALIVYAALYNLIPAVRWFLLRKRNDAVKLRNLRREEWSAQLALRPQLLQDKILSGQAAVARASASRTVRAGSTYSTKDAMSVEGQRLQRDAFKDFDEKLL